MQPPPGTADTSDVDHEPGRRRRGLSLRARFVLVVGVTLLPLVNLAVTALNSVSAYEHAARGGSAAGAGAVAGVSRQGRLAIAFALVVGTVVAVVAGRLLARSVLRPLAALQLGAQRLGRGELGHRLRLARSDELGRVADAFDAMADELQAAHEHLAHGATHDPLTGLPNRRLLHAELVARTRAPGPWSVLLVDLDGFKGVNDSLGHGVGDEVLRVMAGRLAALVPAPGLCARLGGDEFAVLLPSADGPAAREVAERLRTGLRRPLQVAGREVVLAASTGIVVAPAGSSGEDSPDDALRDADLAMYAAKRAGGDRAEVFVPAMHRTAVARLEREGELRRGLARGEVVAHYQPVVEVATGRLLGVEALARWQHPERGLLPPAEFVPLAEESDLVLALGRQVLDRACDEVARWGRRHGVPLGVSVNVSARQLQDPTLPAQVRAALAASGLPPGDLTLEITETVVMQDPEACLRRLLELREQGVRLAVDDFGTGYSSLGYLQRFPVQILKIDRSFVAPLATDPEARVLFGAVLRLAETLSLRVVAEGVETREQADLLDALGCTHAQGYLYGRPAPLAALDVPTQRLAG